ncbi:conserved membrane protein of unknown function [Rhodococcus sp. RD6.2]|uniref:hypothetical protein n=1 Tax=Rhodococcus sp. RD6.2 TaxID=260936 RepID=UPI00063B2AD0|nr:hypothetical protein [Rhodococcus sp. RD6.2]CRK54617.1 conserved membrane protein of unknown function [Rhodococcus sp. RD6.2]
MSNNTATGRHRRLHRSLGVTTFLGTVTVASIVASGVAVAAPGQAGLAPDGDQPGLSDGQSAQAGLPETAAPAPAPAEAWVPVPEQYSQPTAPLPNWDYEANEPTSYAPTYTPPIDYSQLHLPTQIDEPTPVYIAPRDTVMVGNLHFTQPNWMSDDTTARTNATTGAALAAVTDFWRSTGIPADQAQQLAAAQIAGAAGGAIIGAVAAGAPAATLGALIGGTIGGTSAMGFFSPVVTPVGAIPAGVVGTATGAGIGAAALGVPAAAVGAVGGGAAGLAAATIYGDGTNGTPTTVEVPDIDEPAITEQTQATLDSWEQSGPAGEAVTTFIRDTAAAAPVADQQIRESVSSVAGGDGALAAFDQMVSDFQTATGVPGLPLGMIAGAIGAGIPA